MQLGVENNILKVYQNPLIRKLLSWGEAKGGFQSNNRDEQLIALQQNYFLRRAS